MKTIKLACVYLCIIHGVTHPLLCVVMTLFSNIQGDRVTKQGALPSVGSLLGFLDVNNMWQLMDKMAKQVPLDAPWNAPHAKEWDRLTVKQLIEQKCWTR